MLKNAPLLKAPKTKMVNDKFYNSSLTSHNLQTNYFPIILSTLTLPAPNNNKIIKQIKNNAATWP
jgi:hypothetical protein